MRLLLYLLLCTYCVSGRRLPWWSIKIAQEQGPNACVVEEIPATGQRFWTECKYWTTREICGQKTIIRYECCEGYQQVEGLDGCTGVTPLKNVLDTARDLGATRFVKYLEDAKLTEELSGDGTFTLLAPTNKAIENAPYEIAEQLELYGDDPRNPLLLYHLADGRVTSRDINRDLLVDSRYQDNTLRFNAYATGVVTVNCAPLVRKDQQATNGVVHLIDHVLDPKMFTSKSIVDIVSQDGRFSELSKALDSSGYMNQLRMQDHALTFFAPSDEAFQKIPAQRLEKIMADKEARDALLQNHVMQHPICPQAIQKPTKMRTMSDHKVVFDCDEDGSYIEDTPLVGDYIFGDNGIVHVINDVLMPDRARSLAELLESQQLWTFLSLVKQAGLYETFSDYGDYTIFAPSEEAFREFGAEKLAEVRQNPEMLRKLVLFHCTQGRVKTSSMSDNQALMSLDEENRLRLQVYRKALGIENALLETTDVTGQNGILHVISNVLQPANQSAGDLLRELGTHTNFLMAMEKTMNVDEEMKDLSQSGRAYTFLAPSDEAFEALGKEQLDAIMEDTDYLTRLVKNHIINSLISSNSFKSRLHYNIKTKLNDVQVIKKHNQLWINGAKVEVSDLMTSNGMVHLIDKVLLPTADPRRSTHNTTTTIYSIDDNGRGYNRTSIHITRTHEVTSSGGGRTSYRSSHSSSSSSSSSDSYVGRTFSGSEPLPVISYRITNEIDSN